MDFIEFHSYGMTRMIGAKLRGMHGNQKSIERGSFYTFEITQIEGILTVQNDN